MMIGIRKSDFFAEVAHVLANTHSLINIISYIKEHKSMDNITVIRFICDNYVDIEATTSNNIWRLERYKEAYEHELPNGENSVINLKLSSKLISINTLPIYIKDDLIGMFIIESKRELRKKTIEDLNSCLPLISLLLDTDDYLNKSAYEKNQYNIYSRKHLIDELSQIVAIEKTCNTYLASVTMCCANFKETNLLNKYRYSFINIVKKKYKNIFYIDDLSFFMILTKNNETNCAEVHDELSEIMDKISNQFYIDFAIVPIIGNVIECISVLEKNIYMQKTTGVSEFIVLENEYNNTEGI